MVTKLHIAMTGLEGEAVFSEPFELLADELAPRLCQRGHEVTVYRTVRSAPAETPKLEGVREVVLPGSAVTLGQSLMTNLFGVIQASLSSADVLLQVHAGGGWFQRLPRLFGRRAVLHAAGLDVLDGQSGPLANAWLRHSVAVGCRLASRVVVDSDESRRLLERRFGRRCELISYGANLITSVNPGLLASIGLVSAGYYLCVADRLDPGRARLAAEAFAQSESPRPLVVAVHHAPGPEQATDANPARVFREKLAKRAKIIAVGPNTPLWKELLVHAFAYIHSDLSGKAPPVILSALGAGACVLAEDNPYAREVLAEGAYGLFWAPSPASLCACIRKLERDPPLAARLRRLARRRIQERYSWDHVTEEYERLFLQVSAPPQG
ncbi:MAG: glycosyltransferase [Verrucomicrobia bacterium]|nr:glycosyltransferase [Verrucomicrobiota bacterium]